MNDKQLFREKLAGILQAAEEKKRCMSVDEIDRYFQDDGLSEEQKNLVYEYLLSQKINVKGYQEEENESVQVPEKHINFSVDEERYLKEYLEELHIISNEKEMERIQLFDQVISGDTLAKSRLVELYLPVVVDIAKDMYHPDVFLGDLIQEGNVSLLLSMDLFQNPDEADEVICREIRQGIKNLIEEQTDQKRRDQAMVEKVQYLEEGIKTLTEDNEKKVSVEELAFYLEMSEEEIQDILRLAGEEGSKDDEK